MFSWFVLKFRPGHDALGLRSLDRLGLTYAYPMHHVVRPRRPRVSTPVFPGYALVFLDPVRPVATRYETGFSGLLWPALCQQPGIAGLIHDGVKPLQVRDYEIEDIFETPDTARVEPGASVKIKNGPFANFMARVKSYDTCRDSVTVTANIFGRDSDLSYARDDVELSGGATA